MPVCKDPHCKCGEAIVGTVKNGICHGLHHCGTVPNLPDDWIENPEAYRTLLRIFGEKL